MQIISYGDPSILSGDFNEAMMAGRRRRCDDCDYEDCWNDCSLLSIPGCTCDDGDDCDCHCEWD